MRIQALSDLHLERFTTESSLCNFLHTLKTDADCIIMAGDIFGYHWLEFEMKCVADIFNDKEIIFIPGNHEYYTTSKSNMDDLMKAEAKRNGIVFLENGYHVLDDDCVVIGACGWHDTVSVSDTKFMNDFRLITELNSDPYNSVVWNRESYNFFVNTLEMFKDKKVICVTHNSPLPDHTPHKYKGDMLNQFFVNNWVDIIDKYKPKVWISGHIHQKLIFEKNGTLFIENGYGYHGHAEVPDFKRNLVVNIT